MFLESAARTVDFCLTTAPPHLAAPLGAMRTTRPVVVLLVIILFVAILAHFLAGIEVLALPQLRDFVVC
jgi:hypothetical protein